MVAPSATQINWLIRTCPPNNKASGGIGASMSLWGSIRYDGPGLQQLLNSQHRLIMQKLVDALGKDLQHFSPAGQYIDHQEGQGLEVHP